MKKITRIEELASLSIKEKFYLIKNGEIFGYNFAGLSPMLADKGLVMVMAINDSNYKDAVVFSRVDFIRTNDVFVKGAYVPSEIRDIMVDQLNEKIESLKGIYK